MKIKTDFITNSSSTSFIYISSSSLTLDKFLLAAGIEKDSPLINMFTSFYEIIVDSISTGEKIYHIDELINEKYPQFSEDALEKAEAALSEGKNVILGRFSSDNNALETFLCLEVFEIESSDFLINAYDNAW